MNKYIKVIATISLILLTSLICTKSVSAITLSDKDNYLLRESQTINGSLYTTGNNIQIDGSINGDLICAGKAIHITGKITGDLICAGQIITIDGIVQGNVRAAAQTIVQNGKTDKNVTIFAQEYTLNPNALINGELYTATQNSNILGTVQQEFLSTSQNIYLNGILNSPANLYTEKLNIQNNAKLNNDLNYTSRDSAIIDSQATILGKVNKHLVSEPKVDRNQYGVFSAISKLISLLSYLLLTSLIVYLLPNITEKVSTLAENSVPKSLITGLVILIFAPIILILILFTVIGIPIAILGIMLYIITLIISKVFVAVVIGKYLSQKIPALNSKTLLKSSLLGVLASWVIYSIPVLGPILSLLATIWGIGALTISFRKNEPVLQPVLNNSEKK